MSTERLIESLERRAQPVTLGQAPRLVAAAALAGLVGAVTLLSFTLGLGPALHPLPLFGLKIGFSLSSVGLAALQLTRLAYPEGATRAPLGLLLGPFVLLAAAGAFGLLTRPPADWPLILLHASWLECLLAIPLIALAPFLGATLVLRRYAPTHLRRTGAVAGLFAGAASAAAYALHCQATSAAFVALWYGLSVLLCGLLGALAGPRLLRW